MKSSDKKKQKINFFDSLLAAILSKPKTVVFVILCITVFFTFQIPKTELDNNNIRFVPANDQARLTSAYIDETFGSSLFVLVALERKYGTVFERDFLNLIREFNSRMEEIEIAGVVNSIVTSDYIYAEGDSIIVHKLAADDYTGTAEEIAILKQRLLSWDIYRRALISDDFTATQILIPLSITDEQASRPEVIDSFIDIRNIAKEIFSGHAEVYVTGIPIISAAINEAMRSDLTIMVPLVVLVTLIVLFFSFRHFTPVALPLITVVVAAVWSMGVMPLAGIKLSVVSTVLPVILVAIGSSYGIHIVIHYLEGIKGKTGMSREEHTALVLSVPKKIGKAVFLAAITTVAGFFSFCITSVVPLREFGVFASFGVFVSFLIAITLIPSLLLIRGPKPMGKESRKEETRKSMTVNDAITAFFTRIAHSRAAVIFVTALVIIVSVRGLSMVIIDNVFVEYFKTTTDIYRSDRFIREKFGGSKIVSVVAQAESTEALLMPEVLTAMDNLGIYLEEKIPEVGKVMGFTDLIKRINQVYNANESPGGLRPAVSYADDSFGFANDAFGFGDFGFGDFGFGDFGNEAAGFDSSGYDSFQYDDYEYNNGYAHNGGTISAADMVRLMREAASSGKNRYMNANDLVREIERLVNYEGAAYYEIPADPARYGKTSPEQLSQLVANYLFLLSGNISTYANDPLSPTAFKTTIQLRTLGDKDTSAAIESIKEFIRDNFPKSVTTIIGGSALVEGSLNRLVVQSQIISIIISIFVVLIMIAIVNRSITAGIVSIAPLSICILINFAVMGFAGIKLNIGTSMMASLCVAIGIDYTIHYIEAYKREYQASDGKGDFLVRTFSSAGKAILIDALSTGAGFAVLLLSQFVMLQDLGLLIALAMGSSALVGLTIIPVLLSIINPKFIKRQIPQGDLQEEQL